MNNDTKEINNFDENINNKLATLILVRLILFIDYRKLFLIKLK